MIKKIVILGLGVILSANLMVPTMASETDQDVNVSVEAAQTIEKDSQNKDKIVKFRLDKQAKPFTKEEHLAKINEVLAQLEQKYEDGNIEEEKYNEIKERYTKIIEAIENGEMPELGKGKFLGHVKALSQEEMLEKLNEQLAGLETKLNDGKIEQDEYDKIKEKITKTIEAVENGEMPKMGKGKGFMKHALSQEEMLEKLNEKLAGLEEKMNNEEITEEQYNSAKERIQEIIEKVENGEAFDLKGRKARKDKSILEDKDIINNDSSTQEEKSL
ncbi:hypothetical protein [Vallitalea maricola]|uniref:Uncharacterized protein n=1 Tax=Vallitalea maricola TaxID=3074433 RepID=A0ACB5UMR3_9FIRM|nr:hypothetical protein AN2V17_34930 [Vallitalea sp. AN17-2]